jgi:hypothetical protein
MNYIDQNAVVVGLAAKPEEWKASAAFYKSRNMSGLVDFSPNENKKEILSLPSIPYIVTRIIPPLQLEHILQYIGAYAVSLEKLFDLIPKIPKIGETKEIKYPHTFLHYLTGTHEYNIYEYDGKEIMYGKIRSNVFPVGHAPCLTPFFHSVVKNLATLHIVVRVNEQRTKSKEQWQRLIDFKTVP